MGTLYIFDFDDTLFQTENKIRINDPDMHGGKEALSTEEYIEFEKEMQSKGEDPEDHVSFGDFHTVRDPKPIHKNLKVLRERSKKSVKSIGSLGNMVILTARSPGALDSIRYTMREHGYPPIMALSAQSFPGASVAEKKKNAIRTLLKGGQYANLEFFDDSLPNIKLVEELAQDFPRVRFTLKHVGKIKTSEAKAMPRRNVPHRVDEIADAILKNMKSDLSKERKYEIAYGTAWKRYREENPGAKKQKKKSSILDLELLKMAQDLDNLGYFELADDIDRL